MCDDCCTIFTLSSSASQLSSSSGLLPCLHQVNYCVKKNCESAQFEVSVL